ncbi:MAG: transglutaminase domain-containing protein, partial [Verrucomicrobia bacterium]|nr:transglutaminase domain-containing protein [Verrucomicrobiota bacterium]
MRIILILTLALGGAAPAAAQPGRQTPADPAANRDAREKRDQPAPRAPAGIHHRIVSNPDDTYRVQLPRAVLNRSITIANVGADPVVNPRLIANGRRNWFSTADILAGIVTPGMSDRDKALAIWRFLVDNRYHDAPAHQDIEMHDPVRFLNVYGYGFCDDSATNFMVLAGQAGLKARVWGLSGHVVPEAWFEGGWRMLDPDGKIYYLEDDGHAIAGVKTLEQRPDLIHKYPSPYYTNAEKLIAIYCSADDNKLAEGYRKRSEAVHTMAFTLRPGESLTRHHDNWGVYFTSHSSAREPRNTAREHFGNGTFAFAPVFENDIFRKGADSVSNLRAERAGDTWVLASDHGEGSLVYRFASPYPYLDGWVKIAGHGRVALAFSETGDTWSEIWTSVPGAKVDTTVRLGGYFRTRTGRPTYAYRLKLTLDGQV